MNIEPAGTTFNVPINIRFTWLDEDNDGIVDDTSLREANLRVYKDGVPITGLCRNETLCNQSANVFDVQVSSLSEFVIVALLGECEDVIATIKDTLSLEMFTGKNAEKDYTGLTKKLIDCIAKFEEGKCEDAWDKLNDFQNKVVKLAAEGKVN